MNEYYTVFGIWKFFMNEYYSVFGIRKFFMNEYVRYSVFGQIQYLVQLWYLSTFLCAVSPPYFEHLNTFSFVLSPLKYEHLKTIIWLYYVHCPHLSIHIWTHFHVRCPSPKPSMNIFMWNVPTLVLTLEHIFMFCVPHPSMNIWWTYQNWHFAPVGLSV